MKKQDIKNILMSMRTTDNEREVKNLLGKIDMMEEKDILEASKKVGDTEESVRSFFEQVILKNKEKQEHIPINDIFTYGITDNCIHLHLPGDLHQMIATKGFRKTLDIVNLQLLDAIDKIRALKKDSFYRFQGKDSIYMISPILLKRELKFLDDMDFTTQTYSKKELNDDKFVSEHPEASLATNIFGKDKSVGSASITFDIMETKEWQERKQQKIKEFNEMGIFLDEERTSKE